MTTIDSDVTGIWYSSGARCAHERRGGRLKEEGCIQRTVSCTLMSGADVMPRVYPENRMHVARGAVSRLLCHYTLCVRTEETRVLPFPLSSLLAPSVENRGNTERVSSEYTWNLEVEKWKSISVVVRIDFNTNESVSEAFLVTLASFSGN